MVPRSMEADAAERISAGARQGTVAVDNECLYWAFQRGGQAEKHQAIGAKPSSAMAQLSCEPPEVT
jgi:hypothetical protein